MVERHEIRTGSARLELVPELGGGISALEVDGRPVLRPWVGEPADPFKLACNVLVPFSNRISKGRFLWNGRVFDVEPNLPGEPFPIHGDGFQRAWELSRTNTTTRMTLADGEIGPWQYSALQEFSLTADNLKISLTVTNKSTNRLPFGAGFHPWFPRDADTQLSFPAKTVWLEDAQHLPDREVALADVMDLQFDQPRPLPSHWINNCYTGWSGHAKIGQGQRYTSCRVSASENLSYAMVFSTGHSSNFFCFEPVSHPVDALHQPKLPGLHDLGFGESLTVSMLFHWA